MYINQNDIESVSASYRRWLRTIIPETHVKNSMSEEKEEVN
jgi:hypothetical protein